MPLAPQNVRLRTTLLARESIWCVYKYRLWHVLCLLNMKYLNYAYRESKGARARVCVCVCLRRPPELLGDFRLNLAFACPLTIF
jgi:hypothetical protein